MNDIYVSEQMPDGSFGVPALVAELNSASGERRPSIRFDGLELFLISNRPGGSGLDDLWVSARATVFDAWSTPVNLGATVNSAFNDGQPNIASDRETLFFSSNRPAGFGGFDLYWTTRTKMPPGKQ